MSHWFTPGSRKIDATGVAELAVGRRRERGGVEAVDVARRRPPAGSRTGRSTWSTRMPRRLPLVLPLTTREIGGPDQNCVMPDTCQPRTVAFTSALVLSLKNGSSYT